MLLQHVDTCPDITVPLACRFVVEGCTGAQAFTSVDDSCGWQSHVTFVSSPGGVYTVVLEVSRYPDGWAAHARHVLRHLRFAD